jgi:hypothetical protein
MPDKDLLHARKMGEPHDIDLPAYRKGRQQPHEIIPRHLVDPEWLDAHPEQDVRARVRSEKDIAEDYELASLQQAPLQTAVSQQLAQVDKDQEEENDDEPEPFQEGEFED